MSVAVSDFPDQQPTDRATMTSEKSKKDAQYAVIFPNQRTKDDAKGYAKVAKRMIELVEQQPGCLGFDSARDEQGFGITVSYWDSMESIKAWSEHGEHLAAQLNGRGTWYAGYDLYITKIEHMHSFRKK